MSKVYKLSNLEVWALSTLVYLPIDGESILGQWLAEFPAPALDQIVEGAVNTLEAKGIIDPARGEDVVPEELLDALLVLALTRVRLTAAIERDGKFTYSYFGQLEDSIVQYDTDGESIQFHAPDQAYEFSAVLIPEWFRVEEHEEYKDSMPFGAFVMLQTALQLDTVKAVIEESEWGPVFTRSELIDAFNDSKDWVDVYSAAGIGEIQTVSRMPIKEYFDLLYDRGYLQQAGSDSLQIGPRASSIRALYGDPDRCVLTLSVEGIGLDRSSSGALIFGEGRLFLLRTEHSGQLSLEQLGSTHAALGWASDLVARASAVPAVVPEPPDIESLQQPQAASTPSPQVAAESDDGFQALPSYAEPNQAFAATPAPPPQQAPAHAQPAAPAPGSQPPPYAGAPMYPPSAPPPKKRRSGCLITAVAVIVLLLCIGLVIGGAVFIFGMSLPWTPVQTPTTITQPTSGQASVWVVNNSDDEICYLYISPTGDEDWGEDQLGDQETIPPGGTWNGSAGVNNVYDLGAFDCAGNMLGAQYGVTLTDEGITFTLNP